MPADLDLKRKMQPDQSLARDYLRLLPEVKKVLESSEITPRTSGAALQIGGGNRKWTPADTSEVERWVLRHDWEITLAGKIHATLGDLEVGFYEAQVLYWSIWKGAPLIRVADFLDVHPDVLKAAKQSLFAKVAAAMGPVEREMLENRRSRTQAAQG